MSAKPIETGKLREFLRGFGRTDPEELRHAALVSLWVRWLVLAFCLLEVNYRVEYGALSHVLNNFYVLGFMAANGYVHHLVRRRGEAKPAWLLGLSVMDLAGISFSTSLSGGFDSPYFPLYYFAVAMFAWVFTSPRLALSWTTLVVAVYSVLSVLVGRGWTWTRRRRGAWPTGWWPCTPSPARSVSSPASSGTGEGGEWSGSGSCSGSASKSPRASTTPRPSGPT